MGDLPLLPSWPKWIPSSGSPFSRPPNMAASSAADFANRPSSATLIFPSLAELECGPQFLNLTIIDMMSSIFLLNSFLESIRVGRFSNTTSGPFSARDFAKQCSHKIVSGTERQLQDAVCRS